MVAVGLSALFVGRQPTPTTTYSGSTAILLREYVTAAAARFLGLMLGVLLTFFVHYLLQIRARERRVAKDEPAS